VTRWHHENELEDLNAIGGHCPRCGAEYRPGFTTCADCNVPLVAGPATPHPEPPRDEEEPEERDWWDRVVHHHRGDEQQATEPAKVAELPYEEAWLLAGRLRADGIPATVFPPQPQTVYGMALTRSYSVLVPMELLDQAREAARPYFPEVGR
jgi:hypothetical protein